MSVAASPTGQDELWLSSWVAPHHLRGERLDGYRRAFTAHPARLAVVPSFLCRAVADRVAGFLEREAEYRPQHGLYSRENARQPVTEEEWRRAPAGDRFFRFSAVSGVRPEFRLGANVLAYLKIVRALHDARFITFAERISGLALGSLHLHVHGMTAGDFLSAHSDARDDRRLAFVLFLSRAWDPAFGGVLHLTDAGGRQWAIEPTYNTLVIFDVSAHEAHQVTPIEPAAGTRTRVTLGGWIENRRAR